MEDSPAGTSGIAAVAGTELLALLDAILDRVDTDLSGTLGTAVTVRSDTGHTPTMLAATGASHLVETAQLIRRCGPVIDALRSGQPVVTDDVRRDPRWPGLDDAMTRGDHADLARAWEPVRGIGVVTGHCAGTVVALSATLDRPAGVSTIVTLARQMALVRGALDVAVARLPTRPENLVLAPDARGMLDRAVGVVMGAARCDAAQAWRLLVEAGRRFELRPGDLGHVLVQTCARTGAEPVAVSAAARGAANATWAALRALDGSSASAS